MGTKPQSKGLLSKVAKIFRAPGDSSSGGNARDAAESQLCLVGEAEKNALQALIQRKRQDDLVRRREFNYLRKLRRSPNGVAIASGESGDRVSSFPVSSGFTVDDRASTLKKINAIEAHMISSWARSKVASSLPLSAALKVASEAEAGYDYVPTQPTPLRSEVPPPLSSRTPTPDDPVAAAELDNLDLDFTCLLSTPGSAAVDTWDAPGDSPTAPPVLKELAPQGIRDLPTLTEALTAVSGPVPALASAIPVPAQLPDHIEAALQDAAIHFAEGDSASAETLLLALLRVDGIAIPTADVLASALFDLYRTSGQQDGFDVVALDYAERFGRSPAEWFSVPELLRHHAKTLKSVVSAAPLAAGTQVWESPRTLTLAALQELRIQFAAPDAVWHIDWLALADIEVQAAQALADLMEWWSTQPVELHWRGVESLLRTLELRTPANDTSVDTLWWRLRLDALCILQRHDDFESLALDYCVVYEVSPPSWKAAACRFVQDQSPSIFGALAEGPASVPVDNLPVLAGPYAACELAGEVRGAATEAISVLLSAGESADHVVVSCALIVSMDFPAADSVLNWVIERESQGCHVHFVHVPRLVAVFFQMLGIDRYAKISVRSN